MKIMHILYEYFKSIFFFNTLFSAYIVAYEHDQIHRTYHRTIHIEKNRRKIFCFISFLVKLLKKYYTCISIITLHQRHNLTTLKSLLFI